jgi:hypothetical protein
VRWLAPRRCSKHLRGALHYVFNSMLSGVMIGHDSG